MPGGLFALVAYGAQDVRLSGNPEVNFFQFVYRTHIHLAKEPIEVTPVNALSSPEKTRITESRFKIKRSGDYVNDTNLIIRLPELIVSEADPYQIRWAPYPGIAMIDEIRVMIGGTEVQTLDRDRIYALYQLDYPNEKRALYETMIGHVPELVDPTNGPYKTVSGDSYPYAQSADTFSIPSRELCIPLPFWFTKDTSVSLPVGFLTKHEIEIVVRFAPYDRFVQVRDTSSSDWTAPPASFDITNYFTQTGRSWEMNPRMECLYYFLPDEFRNMLATQEVLIPVFRLRDYTNFTERSNPSIVSATQGQSRFDINRLIQEAIVEGSPSTSLQELREQRIRYTASDQVTFRLRQESNPIRRFMILARRRDFLDDNQWDRLGNFRDPENGRDASGYVFLYDDPIIQDFTFRVNGNPIVEELRSAYLREYDTYKCHTGSNPSGILSYSFGIENSPTMSSGTINLGRIREPLVVMRTTPTNIAPSVYSVKLIVEAVNWFRYSDGFGGLVYSS
jgi:hypothetical protein